MVRSRYARGAVEVRLWCGRGMPVVRSRYARGAVEVEVRFQFSFQFGVGRELFNGRYCNLYDLNPISWTASVAQLVERLP